MREIKFRAWDTEAKMFLHHTRVSEHKIKYLEGNGEYRVIYQQYTGLKDKSGKEIYEGDIVEFNDFDSLRTGGHTEDNILKGDVNFSCGAWIVNTERGQHDLYTAIVNDEEIEIIGNKFTKPELLI